MFFVKKHCVLIFLGLKWILPKKVDTPPGVGGYPAGLVEISLCFTKFSGNKPYVLTLPRKEVAEFLESNGECSSVQLSFKLLYTAEVSEDLMLPVRS